MVIIKGNMKHCHVKQIVKSRNAFCLLVGVIIADLFSQTFPSQ